MKYFSLFSGIGGFECGIKRVLPDAECVGYSEVNKYAIQIYEKHYPNHPFWGDATKIKTKEIPDFDLLVAGFPCQSFSIAGKGQGFCDPRGTLFFEIARVLKDKRPRYFLLENVKGLLSNNKGKTFQTILEILANMGYFVEWQVLNSKDFGVPQNRERVFIIGHFGGPSRGTVFPILHIADANLKELTRSVKQTYRVYDVRGLSPTLTTSGGGLHEPKILDGKRIRKLTPKEYERLQGFPDNYTKYNINGEQINDTARYNCLGNSVTTNIIEMIIKEIQ